MPVGEGTSRRAILLGGGRVGALLILGCAAGCTSRDGTPTPSPTPTRATPPPDQDLALRRRVAVEVLALRAAYTAVIDAVPSLRRTLAGLAAEHDAHAAALDPTASTPTATTSSSGSSPPAALSRSTALRRLAGLEQAAATRRTADVLVAGPDLARLLASIAACEATHAVLLEAAT